MWQIFSRMRLKWYFFLENVISPYFLAKIRKKFEVRKYEEETEYFEKKNAFILLKGILNNVRGRKISRR